MMMGRSLDQQPYLVDARPTLAVVTICVAIRGQARTPYNRILYMYIFVRVAG